MIGETRVLGIRYSFVGDGRNLREGGALGFDRSTFVVKESNEGKEVEKFVYSEESC
jgi:hypothetical protein